MRSVKQIDGEIDAVRSELLEKHPIDDATDPRAWERAWKAEPALADRASNLWHERGHAQLTAAERDQARSLSETRSTRPGSRARPRNG